MSTRTRLPLDRTGQVLDILINICFIAAGVILALVIGVLVACHFGAQP